MFTFVNIIRNKSHKGYNPQMKVNVLYDFTKNKFSYFYFFFNIKLLLTSVYF